MEESFAARIFPNDCKFGLIFDNINSEKLCELALSNLGKRNSKVFAITVFRDIESIKMADKRYEEDVKMAEEQAFEMVVKKFRDLEEWEYDSLPAEGRKEVDLTLAEWKRRQKQKEILK